MKRCGDGSGAEWTTGRSRGAVSVDLGAMIDAVGGFAGRNMELLGIEVREADLRHPFARAWNGVMGRQAGAVLARLGSRVATPDAGARASGPARECADELRRRLTVRDGMRHGGRGGLASWVRAESASGGYGMNDRPQAYRDHNWRNQATGCLGRRECACK